MSKKTVLLVDDEAFVLNLMAEKLKDWGYETISALSGKEALKVLTNKNADIIILDYLMPEMDGIATLKEIRKINKEIPVIMFTAHPDETSLEGTEKFKVNAYIPKLSEYSDTLAALKTALDMIAKKLKSFKGE